MNAIVATRPSWLTRPSVVGTPLAWAKGTSLYGAVLGGTVPIGVMGTETLIRPGPPDWLFLLLFSAVISGSMALTGALLGAGVGVVQPALLDRVRHRASLPVIALGQTGVGALAGAAVAASWILPFVLTGSLHGAMTAVLELGGIGAALGAITTALWWLPFTMAMVLERRTWPVTAAAAGIVTTLVSLVYGTLLLLP